MVIVPRAAYHDAFNADAGLAPLLLAIASEESGYNAWAIGDGGTSYGYLQMHVGGGLGDGHSRSELLDGPSNMRLGAQYIRSHGGAIYAALQPWSTRDAAWQLYQKMLAEGVGPDDGSSSQQAQPPGLPVGALLVLGVLALVAVTVVS